MNEHIYVTYSDVWNEQFTYEGCSKRFAPHYFSQSLTKIEKCSLKAWNLMFLPRAYRVSSHSGRLRSCSEFLKWRIPNSEKLIVTAFKSMKIFRRFWFFCDTNPVPLSGTVLRKHASRTDHCCLVYRLLWARKPTHWKWRVFESINILSRIRGLRA
jgi:hypothetical protein